LDFDNDGNLDLMIVNGHINDMIERTRHDISYREPPLLLRNTGAGKFEDASTLAGPAFQRKLRGRGLAVGDFDNDGRPDAILTCLGDTPVLLHNTWEKSGGWVGLELQGSRSNRDAIGAKITIQASGRKLVRWIEGGGSYLSSHDKRVIFGLGANGPREVTAEIKWPSGQTQTVTGLAAGRYHRIIEGHQ
jgi:hypothetical protein